eukprot:CAMPEP_0198572994 /NCGR_PEP_ID=MMETSP1462-20131121/112599_1 /TAXON_ID=1333877 /ORGANISM="Brandtodinium nutriculum, Strain RCC3387" /LENGTH=157 /DNA_ID=CAMNT_0044304163 /DNA_START=251 /DNA_END=720 /DNA_ORIENTATION=+
MTSPLDLLVLGEARDQRGVHRDVRQRLMRVKHDDAAEKAARGHVHRQVGVHEPAQIQPRHPHEVPRHWVVQQCVHDHLRRVDVLQRLRQVQAADAAAAEADEIDLDAEALLEEPLDVFANCLALLAQPAGEQGPDQAVRHTAPVEAQLVVPRSARDR